MKPFERRLILASQSPRRSAILREAGFEFEVRPTDIDESFPADMPVDEVAPYLARLKAQAASQWLADNNDVVLASDCVVILDDTIFNKPLDYDDAVYILKRLSGNMHRVVTGVCLLSLEKERVFAGESKVYFEPLSDSEIHYYIQRCQPYDKAGAYAIQEWIGLCKISRIEGAYSNIMGLPMDLVYRELLEF